MIKAAFRGAEGREEQHRDSWTIFFHTKREKQFTQTHDAAPSLSLSLSLPLSPSPSLSLSPSPLSLSCRVSFTALPATALVFLSAQSLLGALVSHLFHQGCLCLSLY